jgi:Zn-dependent peptidase ImmA (M78 family)/transcriptional regulator with XRE-family HTH domain
MTAQSIGARVKALREQLGFSQEALAKRLGFKDRQTLSAIETGERRVSADELVTLSELLAEPLETFVDPFLLIGEGRFSWRQSGVQAKQLEAYEREAGRLIAAHRALGAQLGQKPPLLRRTLGLNKSSSFEEAMAAGERFAEEFDLGAIPAQKLAAAMEEGLGVLVLMVDPIPGVSGAACQLPELDAVLINRQEIAARRHYDLAHELFHILSWDAMPPDHFEEAAENSGGRVEQLANNFAAALLMPTGLLPAARAWQSLSQEELVSKLNATADALDVTASALRWRLVALDYLPRTTARSIEDAWLRNNGRASERRDPPPLYSKLFVARIASAIEEGRLSVRRAASLLQLTVDDLAALFAAHGIEAEVGI